MTMRLFYTRGAISTLHADEAVSFFRSSHLLMAEQAAAARILPLVDGFGTAFGINDPVQRIGYTAYGSKGGKYEALKLKTGFVGQLLDQASASYLLGDGRRVYSPTLMRFCSADSLSPFSRGGLNSYVYCLGDPINRIDSTGQASVFLRRMTPKFIKKLSPRYRAEKKSQKAAKHAADVQRARSEGEQVGYLKGLVDGQLVGFEKGTTVGQQVGFKKGITVSQQVGFKKGYTEGFQAGVREGYDIGTANGYIAGINKPISASEGVVSEMTTRHGVASADITEGANSGEITVSADSAAVQDHGRVQEQRLVLREVSDFMGGRQNTTARTSGWR
ncbi:RHS repeat-associated core domain-containing protein [Pseudomonas putida]|uniref:RHS repeat-associated core domain-containing protein n=1 Tax=Pseudomonas putida TaxID=303 RepID=UPI0039069EBD